jgi:hypothetical protein
MDDCAAASAGNLRSNRLRMRRVVRICLFITFCWVLSGNTGAAQQSSAEPSKPSPTKPVPTPIPLAEVASQAQSAMESLRDIEDSLSADQKITTVEKRLPQLTKEIDLRTAYHVKLLAASLPLESLYRMERTLQMYRHELSTWNHDLTEHAKTLGDQIAHLDQLSKIWQSTLQVPELSQTPPEILKRVQSLIDSIGRTRQATESRRAEVLTLLSRVLESTERVQTVSSSIEQTQAKTVRNLFVPDSPPIWSREMRNSIEESRASLLWNASVSAFITYIKGRPTIFLLHAVIILLLVLVVRWLRRGIHKWTEEEPSLRRAAPVFDLPVSSDSALFSDHRTDLFASSGFAPSDPWWRPSYPHYADSLPAN